MTFGRGRVARRVRGGYDAGEEVHLNLPEGCIIGDLTEGCVEHWATACATGMSVGCAVCAPGSEMVVGVLKDAVKRLFLPPRACREREFPK